jgi:hypothetical protein
MQHAQKFEALAGVGLVLTLPCQQQRGWLLLGEKCSADHS